MPYGGWTDSVLKIGTDKIVTCLTGNADFVSIQTDVAAYAKGVTNFGELIGKADNGDKVAKANRKAARIALIQSTVTLGESVQQICNGDLAMLLGSGFPLRKQPEANVLVKPELKLFAGANAGELVAKTRRQKASKSFVIAYSLVLDAPVAAWTVVNSTSSKTVLSGIPSGSRVWIKIGVLGSKNQILWSDVMQSPYIQ